jgi:2-octaprenyl-6-methoxyphenol hydroxylase
MQERRPQPDGAESGSAGSAAAFDVVIVGGGLVGAALAVALRRQKRSVALIEVAPPPAGAPSWDERCIAVNAASRNILESLGLWEALAQQATPILSTHISEAGRFGVARFTAAEADLPALGYNLPVRALGQLLWAQAGAAGAAVLCPAQLDALTVTAGDVELHLRDDRTLRARLVAAADGAQSGVRRLLDIGAQTRDYDQQAIVTAVRVSRPHQGCAYERFTPDGPIALLPKPGNICSLVWTLPTAQAREFMGWTSARFVAAAQQTFGERLGVFTELGQRGAYPLQRVMSAQLTAPRLVFVGNAAQSLHPVAAQGFNLGLRDVATLAELIGDLPDPGEAAALAEYARRREADRSDTATFTDGLVRLFSNRVPGLSALRHLGLLALDLAPPLKQQTLWRNLGYRGYVPRAAR